MVQIVYRMDTLGYTHGWRIARAVEFGTLSILGDLGIRERL